MLVGMVFCCFGCVMIGVQRVAVGYMGMMGALFMVAVLVVFCGGAVMFGRVFMVLRRLVMMVDVVFGHGILSYVGLNRPVRE
jgi:hypothetical protein